MALKIKLTRIGRKNDPKYRIVIAEARSKRDGKYIEKIGFYDPVPEKHVLEVEKDRLKYWIGVGATFTKGTQRLIGSVLEAKPAKTVKAPAKKAPVTAKAAPKKAPAKK